MIESGSSAPDLFTFNSITAAYGSSGQQDKMEKWHAEFLLIGLRPDIKTFNILIRSYEKAGVYGKIKVRFGIHGGKTIFSIDFYS
jgi:hypothetical protein